MSKSKSVIFCKLCGGLLRVTADKHPWKVFTCQQCGVPVLTETNGNEPKWYPSLSRPDIRLDGES